MFDPNLFQPLGIQGNTWHFHDIANTVDDIAASGFIDPAQLSALGVLPQPRHVLLITGSDGSRWYDIGAINTNDMVLTPFI